MQVASKLENKTIDITKWNLVHVFIIQNYRMWLKIECASYNARLYM